MTQHFRLKAPILLAAAAILIATLACNLVPPASQPTPPPTVIKTEPPPSPTPTPTPVLSVEPSQAAVGAGVTDSSGQATFADPLRGENLILTAIDETNGAPVSGIQVWFMSLGTEVLIIAQDPNRITPADD